MKYLELVDEDELREVFHKHSQSHPPKQQYTLNQDQEQGCHDDLIALVLIYKDNKVSSSLLHDDKKKKKKKKQKKRQGRTRQRTKKVKKKTSRRLIRK